MADMTYEECVTIHRKHQEAHEVSWATWGDAQKLTREQVGMIAFFISKVAFEPLLAKLNKVGAIAETKVSKPAFLPIKRHVRWEDLEDGCVLHYCGNEGGQYSDHEGEGLLVLGELYTVKKDECGNFVIPYSKASSLGIPEGNWGQGTSGSTHCWEFVSNPNFVNGLDKRKTYWLKDQDKYRGAFKDREFRNPVEQKYNMHPSDESYSPSGKYVRWDNKVTVWPVEDFTDVKPVVEETYKVYDGEVKASDKVWWWGDAGPEQKVASGNLWNLKRYPNAYSIAEPPFTMTKLTNGQTIKTYDYMQAPYGYYKAYQAAHPLNKTSDEVKSPADWKVGDIVTPNAGSITLSRGEEYVIEAFVGGNTPLDGRKVRVKGHSYHCPEGYHSSNNLTWVRRPAVVAIPPSEWRKGDVLRVVNGYYKGHCIPTGAEVTITNAYRMYVDVPRPAGYDGGIAGWDKSRFEFVRRP